MKISENLQNLWKSMKINANERKSTEIHENSTEIYDGTQKRPNTEPHGDPEALDGTVR